MQVFKGRAFMAEGEAPGWETTWSGRSTMWGMVGMERTGKLTEVQEEEWEVEIKEGRVVEEMFSLNKSPQATVKFVVLSSVRCAAEGFEMRSDVT